MVLNMGLGTSFIKKEPPFGVQVNLKLILDPKA